MISNKDSYNNICDKWNEVRSKMKINTCIVELMKNLDKNSKVLDIGCGCGNPIDVYLAKNGYLVTGIDISEKMIEKVKALNLNNCEFYNVDVLDFKTDIKYDVVIAFDSIWHLDKERQYDIYKIISSFMKVGGYFLFTHGNKTGEVQGEMFNEKFYYSALDSDILKELLNEAGFVIEKFIEDYKEETTGSRDLLVVAKKIK